MEYAFVRDVNDFKSSEETFDGVEYFPCHLFPLSASRWRNIRESTRVDIISLRCGDNLRVLVSSSKGDVALHGHVETRICR